MSDDIVDVLRSMAAAYPEDIFPVPPPEKQAKDGAAAHVLRRVAVPHFIAAADEIDLLRDAVAELIAEADNPWPSHTDIGQAVDAIAPESSDQNGSKGAS